MGGPVAGLGDEANNQAVLSWFDFSSALATTTFTVSNDGSDTNPPSLNTISLNTTSLDIQAGQTTLLVTAHITDDLSGFSDCSILFVGPSGQKVSGMFDLVSGDRLDGVYQASISLGANAGAVTWLAQWLFLGDEANHYAALSRSYSSALATTTFTVSNDGGDTSPVASADSYTIN